MGAAIYWWQSGSAPVLVPVIAIDPKSGEEIEDPNVMACRCYFPMRNGFGLAEEIRMHPQPATELDRVRTVIAELHRGPTSDTLIPLFPKDTTPRAIHMTPDGTIYLDEPGIVFDRKIGPRGEFLFMRAIARTLLRNCPGVTAFVFLSNGSPRHTLFGHFPAHGRYLLPVPQPKR